MLIGGGHYCQGAECRRVVLCNTCNSLVLPVDFVQIVRFVSSGNKFFFQLLTEDSKSLNIHPK